MNEIITYILTWLCYGDEKAAKRIAYSADEKLLATHDVLIVPNGHLGKDIVLPDMGHPVVEKPKKDKVIIRTDIVYATFFFTSRAEELINPQRDEYGRFAARYSILGKKNRLQIPLLDEYARLVMKHLALPLPENSFGHVYLTHDIDSITQYRHLRGAIGGIARGERAQVIRSLGDIRQDPLYSFPWMIAKDNQAKNDQTQTIYFVKHTHGRGFDYPQYRLWGRDFRHLCQLLLDSGAAIGLHSSYYGYLPHASIQRTHLHRSHYLRCSIEQMQRLADVGITDDFTMGFADQAGFRLQTTRAVRWINPQTMQLTSLTLHPLTIMDNTLSNANYMNLNEDEAYFLCERLIGKVRQHHGDLCLLWHNSSFAETDYHRSLYPKLLQLIR